MSQESEQRLRSYLEKANDLIFVLDKNGRIIYINPNFSKVTGYASEELIGKFVLDFIAPETLSTAEKALTRTLKREDVELFEGEIIAKDGHKIWLEVKGGRLYEGGQFSGFFMIARNITERKQVELALREHSEKLEDMVAERTDELTHAIDRLEHVRAIGEAVAKADGLDNCMQAVAKGCVDHLGFNAALIRLFDQQLQVFTQAAVYPLNKQLYKLLQKFGLEFSKLTFPYIPAENANLDRFMIGQPYLGHSFAELLSPPLPVPLSNAIQRLYRIKTILAVPLVVEDSMVGWLGVGTNQKEISAEDQHALELVARQAVMAIESARYLEDLQYHTTELEHTLVVLQETRASLEQRVEERAAEILKQKQFFESLVSNSPIAILSLDLNNQIISCNPAFEGLFGYSLAEILDQNVDSFIAPKQLLKEATSNTQRVFRGETVHCVSKRLRKDGSLVDVEIFGVPVVVSNQRVGILALYNDITERIQVEEVIRKARDQEEVLRETGTILSATLDFDTVLDLLLEQVQRVVPYDSGNVMLVKGRFAKVARMRGYEKFGQQTIQRVSKLSFNIDEVNNLYRMVKTRQPIVVPDTANYPGWVQSQGSEYVRSWIGAPIVVQDKVIAFFSLDNKKTNYYTSEHAERLAVFTVQAALAFQNARLYEETKEFADKLSTLYEAANDISSTLQLDELIQLVAQRAAELASANRAMVFLVDTVAEQLTKAVIVGDDPDSIASMTYQHVISGLHGWVIRQKRPVLSDDIIADPRTEGAALERIRQVHPRSKAVAVAPLIIKQQVIGTLTVSNDEDRPDFNLNDLNLIAMLANQASIAIENAQLFEAAQQRAQEAETLRKAGAAVAATLQQDEAIELILNQLTHLMPFESASIQLLQGEEGKIEYLEVVGGVGYPDLEAIIGLRFPMVETDPGAAVVREGHALIVADTSSTPYKFSHDPENRVKSWSGVPLKVHGRVIGLLSLDSSKPGYFTEERVRLAESFADQVAIAIENARLFEEVQKLAITDSLTGLFNRGHFFALAECEFARSMRYHHPLSIIMLDIDHFKLFNDKYGHAIGDQVLRDVAACCRNSLRQVDILGRYGGEEFVILLPETRVLDAERTAKRLCQQIIETTTDSPRGKLSITASLGVASIEKADNLTLEQLINYADQALYVAKAGGRGQVSAWEKPHKITEVNQQSP